MDQGYVHVSYAKGSRQHDRQRKEQQSYHKRSTPIDETQICCLFLHWFIHKMGEQKRGVYSRELLMGNNVQPFGTSLPRKNLYEIQIRTLQCCGQRCCNYAKSCIVHGLSGRRKRSHISKPA